MTFKPSHVINEQDERNLESRAKVSLLASQQRIFIFPVASSDDPYVFKLKGTIATNA